jgi:KaiC/GvpD/RAD55 family RecA-like ATPase
MMERSPFNEVADQLISKGLSVIPLQPRSKKPVEKNWTQYCTQAPTAETVSGWENIPNANIGITLGEASGLVALDFDEDIDGLHDKILELLPERTVRKTGARGFTLFFKYSGEKSHKWAKDGEMVLELLSTGRHTVIPPSIHPQGQRYKYETFEQFENPEQLPELPSNFLEQVDKLFNKKRQEVKEQNFDMEDLRTALEHIDSDDYHMWIQVGMALKDALGPDGFEVWDKWSSKSEKYNPNVMTHRWSSFSGQGVSVATIFFYAMESGFEFKKPFALDGIIKPNDLFSELEDWRVNGLDIGETPNLGHLDNLIHIRRGEYTVITGYPNSGKSEFLDSIAMKLMEKDWKFLYCSFEKSPKSHVQSLVHKYTGKRIEERASAEQRDALQFLSKYTSFIGHSEVSTDIDEIAKVAEMYKRIEGLDALVIDPFNYLGSKKGEGYEHTKYINIRCAAIAKQLGIHVFLIAHPKLPQTTFLKEETDKLPRITMLSIAGGQNFAAVADIIMSVSRGSDSTSRVEVLKVRDQDIDKLGIADYKFNPNTKRHEPFKIGF